MIERRESTAALERFLGWIMLGLAAATWVAKPWAFVALLDDGGALTAWRITIIGLGALSLVFADLQWAAARQITAVACLPMWAFTFGLHASASMWTPIAVLLPVFAWHSGVVYYLLRRRGY